MAVAEERTAGERPQMFGYGLALAVFLLDQIVKYWIIEVVRLEERITIPLLPVFNLTWVENRGVSMGLFAAGSESERWLLVVGTAVIALLVAWWLRREKNRYDILALGLVLGGALGNILDRARFGYVVDFLHFFWGEWHFYVFNVADAAITIGVILLVLRVIVAREPARNAESDG